MWRGDYFYTNPSGDKHSLVRLEGYLLFSENLAKRYPGYMLSKEVEGIIVPSTDKTVNLDELLDFFRSKDLSRYDREKDKFFGTSGRFTSANAQE